ncbi:MAG: hypothetical protein MJ053_04570 [Elusimicrobiaceae bacterium]|nr:hypothetical protein [Elusimicrobiaceae bacterium]
MFFDKRAVLSVVLLASTVGLRAFDLQYGTLFKVSGITLSSDGLPVLPLARGKYANVRVLDKNTFEFLQTCAASCKQQEAAGQTEVISFRAAKTRPDMWIADVAVDNRWSLTFLVFKNKSGFSVVTPSDITVRDRMWLSHVEQLLQARAKQGVVEEQPHAM